ncbi:SAM-dependent methyltransferase [Halonatronum saccharophilum]|uniref:SAM-dependent methyltransferase n=1 Tax=Halonatronum saccharophilum TaxID=150060 RepID=UPI00047F824E|nr:class I SAM-dependent methyltransferase [Halonatronum saccharophilum]
MTNNWWAKAYDKMKDLEYDYHYIDFSTAKQEVEFIEEVLNLSKGAEILDLGCGNGRHSILLAQKGYKVRALDYSAQILAQAKREANRREVKVDFIKGDMREIGDKGKYDGIIVLDGSFGIFSDKENEELIKRVSASLKVGGRLLIQSFNPYYIANNQSISYENEGDKTFIRETRFDPYSGKVVDKISLLNNNGEKKEEIPTRYYRAYTLPELDKMFAKANLGTMEVYGHNESYTPKVDESFNVREHTVFYTVVQKVKINIYP